MAARLSMTELADWSRTLSTSLRAGIPVVAALKQSVDRGSSRGRAATQAVLESINKGEDVATALKQARGYFPPLFLGMAQVGVQTGHLPEVFRELEKYYRFQVSLKRRFLQQIFWPVFQLAMAILVIALVIYLLGILPGAMDILGFGLTGGWGAMIWLGGWVALVAAGWFGLIAFRRQTAQARWLDEVLLRIPVVGNALRTIALSRMALALHLTLETGMSLKKAIPLSMEASDNLALASMGPAILGSIKEGQSFAEAFRRHHLLPAEFLDILENAEEAGRVPEAMQQVAVEYSQRAEHQFTLLNQAAGWVVWVFMAIIIIFLIFRIAFTAYLNPLNNMLQSM